MNGIDIVLFTENSLSKQASCLSKVQLYEILKYFFIVIKQKYEVSTHIATMHFK